MAWGAYPYPQPYQPEPPPGPGYVWLPGLGWCPPYEPGLGQTPVPVDPYATPAWQHEHPDPEAPPEPAPTLPGAEPGPADPGRNSVALDANGINEIVAANGGLSTLHHESARPRTLLLQTDGQVLDVELRRGAVVQGIVERYRVDSIGIALPISAGFIDVAIANRTPNDARIYAIVSRGYPQRHRVPAGVETVGAVVGQALAVPAFATILYAYSSNAGVSINTPYGPVALAPNVTAALAVAPGKYSLDTAAASSVSLSWEACS